jgi:hypothetical protein
MKKLLSARHAFCLAVALICGAAFYAIGYRELTVVHPAEDAYILFRYADHIASGHGIVFNIGGQHAEGATDFLWLLLLSAGVWLGSDVAFAALALNAFGAAIAGWILARLCWGDEDRAIWMRALLALLLPAVVLAGGAVAGYWGFSSMLYSALILTLFAVSVDARGRGVLAIPVLGLIVALFRPDGVVVGVPFVVLGLWRASEERILRPYLTAAAVCAVVGIAYVAWRWSYFGLPLPLPLYVKQNGVAGSGWAAKLPGLPSNLEWFYDGTGPKWILAAFIAAAAAAPAWRDRRLLRAIVFMTPVGLLLLALAFAVQTQNLEFRFQSPAHLVLLYGLLVATDAIAQRRTALAGATAAALVVVAVTPSNIASAAAIRVQLAGTWRTYVETFAPVFGRLMKADTTIALTEAGAIPYWTPATVADIVGLNYPDAAVRPPTVDDVTTLDPDIVFLHQGTSLDNALLIPQHVRDATGHGKIYSISPEQLGAALKPSRRAVLERHVTSYDDIGLLNVQYAATVLIAYLSQRKDYDIFIVDANGRHSFVHVWGFKKTWQHRAKAIELMEWSLAPENYRSYLNVRRRLGAHTLVSTNGVS